MANPDVLEKPGKHVVLLGNEAIARGVLEAACGFAAAYPGTPSSEVGNTIADAGKKTGLYFEWSTNEKTAFEACAGAAFSGLKAFTCMKHFGFNVASDSIFPIVYTGVKGALVLMVADDPGGLSSAQSEQDVRIQARLGNLPVLEPSNAQECLDFTKIAFEISKKFEIPVVLRTTTRVSHAIGNVKLGKIQKPKTRGMFQKDFERYYNIAPGLQRLHAQVLEKLKKIEKEFGKLNRIEGNGQVGIITSGVCYEYVKELGLKNVKIAKLNLSNPLPEEFVKGFARGLKKIIVVEELEPVIECVVKQVVRSEKIKVFGKGVLPHVGEFSVEMLRKKILPLLGKKAPKDYARHEKAFAKLQIPIRKPVLCQGCPHRSTFFAAKKAFGNETVWAGDIGCYVLGIFEPLEMEDFIISMGSGTGIAHGIGKVSEQRVVAFMGDSTFFHAGMPAIVNAKYNNSNPIIIVLDNSVTAMTGHQPHAGTGYNAMGEPAAALKIEEIVKAFGVQNIFIANSFNQKELRQAMEKAKKTGELSVVISRGACRLFVKKQLRKQGKEFPKYFIDQKKCTKCRICSDEYACPAIMRENNHIWIDHDLCWGCSVCSQICPVKAILLEPQVAK